jgi:hypothetical protein
MHEVFRDCGEDAYEVISMWDVTALEMAFSYIMAEPCYPFAWTSVTSFQTVSVTLFLFPE